jgi:3-oxoacyl-[acyl-carrier-protein] synthase-1
MNKVVISGRGLITPLGNGLAINEIALRNGTSGITKSIDWEERGLKSLVGGFCDSKPPCSLYGAKEKRFMPDNARTALAAVEEAMIEAQLTKEELQSYRVGVIGGTAGSNYEEVYRFSKAFAESGNVRKVTPCAVPRVMPSSAVANISLLLGITGENYDISSACASSAYALIVAARLIHFGVYDIIIAGGSDQLNWVQALGFNSIRALSTKYNETPMIASRPFDRNRDGFVIAEGAGYLILESEEHAKKRKIKPKAIISGWAANSNATDMVQPNVNASASAMLEAVENAGLTPQDISYVNAHGTATPIGDPIEMRAIKTTFGQQPAINSTKSMTGHMIGATGAVEIIFTTMMMEKNFICPSINLDDPEDEFAGSDLVTELREGVNIKHAISNSFAFGGSNACLVVSQPQ